MVDSRVNIGSLILKNPVMPASGCFAHEYANAMDLARLGALVTKSVTPKRRIGNPVPRVAETDAGMLNSIGIPSNGLLYYVDNILPHSYLKTVLPRLKPPADATIFYEVKSNMDEADVRLLAQSHFRLCGTLRDRQRSAVSPDLAAEGFQVLS